VDQRVLAITEDSIVSGEFTNKVAVVTGGSRGIGREIAADLARHIQGTAIAVDGGSTVGYY
jgi:NAD(P)-dependent dehydrogenase (short-subunit alcohol dehydrogenase family)